jgi:glutathione peroxidase
MGIEATNMRLAADGTDLYGLVLERVDGRPMRLARYWGQALLVVNVASRSPLAGQLQQLEALHQRYGDSGLRVMAFPCNDFDGMEPGSDADIQRHYEHELVVTFPVFTKVRIAGGICHPFFRMLGMARALSEHGRAFSTSTTTGPAGEAPQGVQRNFEKFLISRGGGLLHWFDSHVSPMDPCVHAAIEHALERPREDFGSQSVQCKPATARGPAIGQDLVSGLV